MITQGKEKRENDLEGFLPEFRSFHLRSELNPFCETSSILILFLVGGFHPFEKYQ